MLRNLNSKSTIIIPPPPPRFTIEEWYLNNRQRYRTSADQQALADQILAECDRVRDEAGEIVKLNKVESDRLLEEKLEEIKFLKGEIERQRKEVCLEVEALNTYKERIYDAMEALKEQGLKLCQKCLILRENRIGIDLVHDEVETELLKELDVIKGAQALLKRTLEQTHEQIRRLKSTVYFIDRDLNDKTNALNIDLHNSGLTETDMNLSLYHGQCRLDSANITLEEWKEFSNNNIIKAAQEINSARPLRSYVDTLLKQVIEDLWNQYHTVNEAFQMRIGETKEAKTKLEMQHSEIARQANEMTRNITRLEVAIAEKEGFMALAHTRLGNRAQRPGVELCRDTVESQLANEVFLIKENVQKLQQMLNEAQASLRYLLRTQIQLEEDINVKLNTLQIDEVDCMTIRQSMDYHAF